MGLGFRVYKLRGTPITTPKYYDPHVEEPLGGTPDSGI